MDLDRVVWFVVVLVCGFFFLLILSLNGTNKKV